MYKFNRAIFFLVVLNSYSFVVAGDDYKQDDNIDRGSRSDRAGLWFGPRLGKRALRMPNDDDRQTFLRLVEAADAVKYYYDQLYDAEDEPKARIAKKVIFTPKLGRNLEFDDKTYSVDFTPRLGRRLADELRVTPADQDAYRQEPEQIDGRSKFFSPRLGRTMNFSPRLGREIPYELYPDKIRVVRSTNKTKAT